MEVIKGNNGSSNSLKIITRAGGKRYPIFIKELPDGTVIIETENVKLIKKVSGFRIISD